MEMSINQLGDLTGLNYRTIKNRLKPLAPCREDGRSHFYNTRDALKLLYPTVASELAAENLLLERARRHKMEIEVKQLRGLLLPIEEIAKALSKEYAYLRAQFRSIPSKLAKPLSMVTDPNEVHSKLTEAINECLSELTADAKYQLEQHRLESVRLNSSRTEDAGNDTSADADISGVGGPEEILESGEQQHTRPVEDF